MMKRLILLSALFALISHTEYAANVAALLGGSPPSDCATTDTAIPHDTLLEGFQTATTGYEQTWAEVGTTANITEAADSTALATGKVDGMCNQAFKIVVPDDGTETYARWDNASAIDVDSQAVDIVFYLYIETAPANSKALRVLSLSSFTGGQPASASINLNVSSGGALTVSGSGATTSTSIAVTASQWEKISLHVGTSTDGTGDASTITVNDSTTQGFNRTASHDPQYMLFGAPYYVEAGDTCVIWFDLICVNTP